LGGFDTTGRVALVLRAPRIAAGFGMLYPASMLEVTGFAVGLVLYAYGWLFRPKTATDTGAA